MQPTIDLGAKLLGRNSAGQSSGSAAAITTSITAALPMACTMSIPYWGSRVELMEVIAMARNGRIHAETSEFPLELASRSTKAQSRPDRGPRRAYALKTWRPFAGGSSRSVVACHSRV